MLSPRITMTDYLFMSAHENMHNNIVVFLHQKRIHFAPPGNDFTNVLVVGVFNSANTYDYYSSFVWVYHIIFQLYFCSSAFFTLLTLYTVLHVYAEKFYEHIIFSLRYKYLFFYSRISFPPSRCYTNTWRAYTEYTKTKLVPSTFYLNCPYNPQGMLGFTKWQSCVVLKNNCKKP